jgi:hypothetical protein
MLDTNPALREVQQSTTQPEDLCKEETRKRARKRSKKEEKASDQTEQELKSEATTTAVVGTDP